MIAPSQVQQLQQHHGLIPFFRSPPPFQENPIGFCKLGVDILKTQIQKNAFSKISPIDWKSKTQWSIGPKETDMGNISTPKPFQQLCDEIEDKSWLALVGKYRATDAKGRYLHWDEFQYRVTKGDNDEHAWLATKMARLATVQRLPLYAEGDRCFSYCVPPSLQARLHMIDTSVGVGSYLSQTPLVPDIQKNRYLVKSLLQEEAITSAQLEGASTTRRVAKEMLRRKLPPKDKSQKMIFNNYYLMQRAVEEHTSDLSIDLILDLHRIATEGAIENNAIPGTCRQGDDIWVGNDFGEPGFIPPSASTIPDRLEAICQFANAEHSQGHSFIHPVLKAIILHFMVAYIHPFGDGNGRTARAIFYWSMLRSQYWMFEYISISKFIQASRRSYEKAFIYTENDEFDLTYFLYNQTRFITQAIAALYQYLDQKSRDFHEFRNWVEHSPIAQKLRRGQLEILRDAVRSPGREFTVSQVSKDLGIADNTARGYLNTLADKELLRVTRSKKGKGKIYIAPENLKSRLEG